MTSTIRAPRPSECRSKNAPSPCRAESTCPTSTVDPALLPGGALQRYQPTVPTSAGIRTLPSSATPTDTTRASIPAEGMRTRLGSPGRDRFTRNPDGRVVPVRFADGDAAPVGAAGEVAASRAAAPGSIGPASAADG